MQHYGASLVDQSIKRLLTVVIIDKTGAFVLSN